MEDIKFVLARNLTAYRKANNLTQLELAEKLNYSDKAVSKWERAESVPDIGVLMQIATLYNITIDDLVRDKDVTKLKVKHIQRNRNMGHVFISLLSVGAVFLIAVCAFVLLNFLGVTNAQTIFKAWHCFIIAIPISCIVMIVLSCVWFSWPFQFFFISVLPWSLAVVTDIMLLSADFNNSYLFYLICIPIQLIIIFWFFLRYARSRNKKKSKVVDDEIKASNNESTNEDNDNSNE